MRRGSAHSYRVAGRVILCPIETGALGIRVVTNTGRAAWVVLGCSPRTTQMGGLSPGRGCPSTDKREVPKRTSARSLNGCSTTQAYPQDTPVPQSGSQWTEPYPPQPPLIVTTTTRAKRGPQRGEPWLSWAPRPKRVSLGFPPGVSGTRGDGIRGSSLFPRVLQLGSRSPTDRTRSDGIQEAAPLPPVCDAGTQRGAAASGAGSLSGGSTITNAHISATTPATSRRARSSGTRRGDVIMMTSKAVEVSTPMRNWTL